jgi:RNA polymerase sigma-70 factor (ECF subfamily)
MLAQYQQAIAQHRQRIFSFAHYSLRAKEDAEDVTQEVFIKLWQHWQKIDHNKLGGWLMRVAHNAVVDHVRKQKPSKEAVDHYVEVDEQGGADHEEDQIDQQKFKRQLLRCIKSLDDPFRSIIIMRDVQGMSYAEIQSTLEMSDSQVKVYLHRGRRKLRDIPELRRLFAATIGSDMPSPALVPSASTRSARTRNVQQAIHEKGKSHAK